MKFPDWLTVYGDLSYRGRCPTEAAEQVTFFAELRRHYPDTLGRIALHPRNEGQRTAQQAQRHKADGMAVGAADIIIPGRTAFVCELKRRDHTRSQWQPWQLEYLEAAFDADAWVCVALGWEEALNAVSDWWRYYH